MRNDNNKFLDEQAKLSKADDVIDELKHIVYPTFSLNRTDSSEIHTNPFWDLSKEVREMYRDAVGRLVD